MNAFDIAILQANVRELRKQNAELLARNEELKAQLAAWPERALNHALDARERERRKLGAIHS